LARHLVLKGANTQIKNALGDTAVKLAQRHGHHELALIF